MTGNSVFLDSAYAIALAVPADEHHRRAKALGAEIALAGIHSVTTRDVLVEVANAMSKLRYRAAAITTLRAFEADPLIQIVDRTPELFRAAVDLFQKRMDKEWSLTDCLSFIVMQGQGLTEALTSDEHFEQAGYVALLRQATA